MSAPVPPQNASPALETPSSTPPGGTPTSTTPPAPEPFRYGENAPAWARGKTAEEVLGIAQNLVNTFERAPASPQAQGAVQTQYNAASSNIVRDSGAPTVGDDDYITGKDLKAMLADISTRQVQPAINQGVELGASANLGWLRREHAEVFQKYGPEISQKLASVPKHLWTIDNLETVVKLVKVDHLDEISREQALKLASTMEPTIRSSGAGGSVPVPVKEHSLESERIPAEWKQRASAVGVTEQVVREFCAANEMTPEAFYKQFEHLDKFEGQRNPIVGEIGKARSA